MENVWSAMEKKSCPGSLLVLAVQTSATAKQIVEMLNTVPLVKLITQHITVFEQIRSEKKKF